MTTFAFGDNWQAFMPKVDPERLLMAKGSLQMLTGRARLDHLRFLDIGCGSGLHSLAARQLGATVFSFDPDPKCVECTKSLSADGIPWHVERGSVLEFPYVASLGDFNIVYAWGSLHHTGDLRRAIDNAVIPVARGGRLILGLYRWTPLCWLWRLEKRWFNQASPEAQARACRAYEHVHSLVNRDYAPRRGMDRTCDIRDWLGGYPYESITPQKLHKILTGLGFTHVSHNVRRSFGLLGSGCNEYVYQRR